MKARVVIAAALVSACATGLLGAHHSFATFDQTQEKTLEGTVKEFQWTNPHSWVQLLVTDADGKAVEWSLETASISNLFKNGWRAQSLKPGCRMPPNQMTGTDLQDLLAYLETLR